MTECSVIEISGKQFKKSSFSIRGGARCVGVAHHEGIVSVVNTKTKDPVIEFTLKEWEAFIDGVKNGEFDAEDLKIVDR